MQRATTRNDAWWVRLRRHAIGIVAFEVLLVAGGLLGATATAVPPAVPAIGFAVASVAIAWTYHRFSRPTPRDLHVRAAVHVCSLAVVLHLAGWSGILTPVYLLVASDLQRASGLPVGRLAVGWAVAITTLGQLGIVFLGLPTVVAPGISVGAATVGLLVVLVVVARFEDDARELRRLATAAEQRASRLRAVLAGGQDAVLVIEDGRPVLASPHVADLLGLVDDRHLVEQIAHRIHADDLPAMAGALDHHSPRGEVRVRFRRGDETWTEVDVTWNADEPGGGTVLHLRDVTEQSALRAELERVALVDPLTGLANRRLLDIRLPQIVATANRHGVRSAVLFIDLDGFKEVNDSLGHAVGDDVLRQVADDLRAALREEDTVARFGGDEFVVLLERVARPDDARRVAERLVGALSKPRSVRGNAARIGASVGIRHIVPGDSPASVLVHADSAMYLAKRAGGGTVVDHDEVRRATDAFVPEVGSVT